MNLTTAAEVVRRHSRSLTPKSELDPLIEKAGKAQFVLIGEASHGTHEFYALRAALTRRLIKEKGFCGVALEADWPDAFRIHRYVTGRSEDKDGRTALSDFKRFPLWMWRNTEMLEFVQWLREHNEARGFMEGCPGLFGLDLYSLHASIHAVVEYLEHHDPDAARTARMRYACFEHFGREPENYGIATTLYGQKSCENEVVSQLLELRKNSAELLSRDGHIAQEDFFFAEQNARLIKNAESYYRAIFRGRDDSWNLRDAHMFETLRELSLHLDSSAAKLVVWAHNSHLGNAAATEMKQRGEFNVGQLVREHFGSHAFSIGFSTYCGTVTAARDWGDHARRRHVRPGLPGSYEELFHATGISEFWLDLQHHNEMTAVLREPRLQRAIGVIYRPDTERGSHYFHAELPRQFDAMIHIDETHALEPLDRNAYWESEPVPETYPTGL